MELIRGADSEWAFIEYRRVSSGSDRADRRRGDALWLGLAQKRECVEAIGIEDKEIILDLQE